MSRIVYVNGRYVPYREAGVHVEDRGFQLADAVYEVVQVLAGRLVDERRHLARLARSLAELSMPPPMSDAALGRVLRETLRRNRVRDGMIYLQVTRGAGPREFLFPAPATPATLVCIARPLSYAAVEARAAAGIAVVSVPDTRWARCDIKTVMLLPACLAKQHAHEAGAREAWFVDAAGFITEGASSNAWIVDAAGRLRTRPVDSHILRGVTRTTLIDVLERESVALEERAFTVAEAKAAREAFITSATNTVMPVVSIDGTRIGTGAPGPLTRQLRVAFGPAAEVAT
jgi:D-alanine transaminase